MSVKWALRALAMSLGFTLAGCSLFGPGPLPEGKATREWRAAWVQDIQDEIKNPESAKELVAEARSLNLNTLFLVVVSQGTAYYPSQVVPPYVPAGSYHPLEFDPLQAILDAAHQKGRPLQIFAWVNVCKVWQQQGLIPPNHPVIQHPDWLTANFDPNRPPDQVPEFWLDPGVPAVQQYAGEICRELAAKYPLDGILVDSVQYRPDGFGYNPTALQRFAQETGRLDRPKPTDPAWEAWRARQVTHMMERITMAVRSQRPGLPIAVVGSADGPLTARFEESQAFVQMGQNWPSWLSANLADILVLRDFKRQASREQSKEFLDWLIFAAIRRQGKALICGISGRDNSLLATQTQIREAREQGVQGLAIWRYRENNTEGRPRKALFELLKSKVFAPNARPPVIPWLHKIRTGIVAGHVRTASAIPLSNVRVQFPSLERETYTLPDGLYILFGVPAGSTVKPQAYQGGNLYPAEQSVKVTQGKIGTTDIIVGK